MPVLSGKFVQSNGAALHSTLRPQIEIRPNRAAVTVGGRAISARPVTVTPAGDGTWSANLVASQDASGGDFYYIVRGFYFRTDGFSDSGFTAVDVFEHQIRMPVYAANISDLVERPPIASSDTYVGADVPRADVFTQFQFNPVTNDLYENR